MGHLQCVRALLAADGIDVNSMPYAEHIDDALCMPALHEAACANQLLCLLALLAANGINVNLFDETFGQTAFAYACRNGNGSAAAAEALLAAEGVDASLATLEEHGLYYEAGKTPLHYASENRMIDTVQLLLQRKEVNASAADRRYNTTPLHEACRINHPGIVRALLLGGGCRFKLVNKFYFDHRSQYMRQYRAAPDGTPLGMTTDSDVRTLFASGIDYWQRKHHMHHSWAMKQVVPTLLRVAQRMGARTPATARGDAHAPVQHPPLPLPLLPEEIWLEVLGFLRSADFCA